MKRWLIALLCLVQFAAAQQYFATDGFSKPTQVVTSDGGTLRETAGVYITQTGEVQSVYAAPSGVQLQAVFPPGNPTLLGDHPNVRDVFTGAGNELSAVWIGRNRSNGRSHYHWQTATGNTDLFNLGEQLRLTAVNSAAGEFFVVRPIVGGSQLRVIRPSAPDPEGIIIVQSGHMIDAVASSPSADGALHVFWLAGDTSRSAFGSVADWTAHTQAFDPATWEPVSERQSVGVGSVLHPRDRSVVAELASGLVALWPSEDGTLLQGIEQPNGWDVTDTGITGRIISSTNEGVYWYEGTSIFFAPLPLTADARSTPPLVSSPVTIEGANLHARSVTGEFHTAITWFGRTLRGLPEVYISHTFAPYTITWWDRVVAGLGWNPWNYGEQFFGQLLTALVVAAVGGLILLTLVWLLKAVLLDRLFPRMHAQRMGEYSAAVVFLSTMLFFSYASGGFAQLWSDTVLLVPITIVGLLAGRIWRPGYRQEPFLISILSSFLVLVVTLTIWVFATYPRWATLIGLT